MYSITDNNYAISTSEAKQQKDQFITASGLIFDRKPTPSESDKIKDWLNSQFTDTSKKSSISKNDWESLQRSRSNTPFNWKKARAVKILDDFLNLKWLWYPQLFGLAQDMYWRRGGQKKFKDTLKAFNEKFKGQAGADGAPKQYLDKHFKIMKGIKKANKNYEGKIWLPAKLKHYSPHTHDHQYENLLTATRKPNGYTREIEPYKSKSLSMQTEKFQTKFQEFKNDNSNSVWVFKVDTGFGKSEALLDMENAVIATPTHSLKDEMSERMKADHLRTPDKPKFTDEKHNEVIALLTSAGLSTAKYKYIKKIANGGGTDGKLASTFLLNSKKAYSTKCTILTTHPRGVYTEFENHSTIIFDECPMDHLLPMGQVDINDVMNMGSLGESKKERGFLSQVREKFLDIGVKQITESPKFSIDVKKVAEQIIERGFQPAIIQLLNSDYIFRDNDTFHFLKKRELPNKKIGIFSATANLNVYRRLFGERLKIVDLTGIENKGTIIQHTARSYSRHSIKNAGIENITAKIDTNIPTITFKEFTGKIPNAVSDIYFGNCNGYDRLKGMDINILGTPHVHPAKVFLYAEALGINYGSVDTSRAEYKFIENGGFEFRFNTYEHNELSKLQISFVREQLMQAVGRARVLREDSTVHVYSQLPLKQADERFND